MKKLRYFLFSVGLLLATIYLIPVKKKSFNELYAGNQTISQSLLDFRKNAPKEISINGTKWNYIDTQIGDSTIVFLHGMGGAGDIWWQQINALKEEYRIISPTLPHVESIVEAADGILAILEKENINKTILVGSSMGGYIAQFLLQNHPEIIEKVVLGNTFPPNQIQKEKNKGIIKLVPILPEWLIMRTFRNSLGDKVIPSSQHDPLVKAYLLEQYSGLMSKDQFIGRINVVFSPFFDNQSESDKLIPKLIIQADNDPLVEPELRQKLLQKYPEAQVFTFHKKGHFGYLNEPDTYTKVLKDFFDYNERDAVTETIKNYFKGRKEADIQLLVNTFHPNARLLTSDSSLQVIPLKAYLDVVQKAGQLSCITQLKSLQIHGNKAIARTIFDYGKKKYEDYLTLIKIKNKWWIINKTFEKI